MVRVFNAHPRHRIRRKETLRLVRRVLHGEQRRPADLNVVYVDDSVMTRLNTKFLRHRRTTDVLSFVLEESGDPGAAPDAEVYVNLDQARRQARDAGVRFTEEVARLVIHGILHLAGHDDATGPQRRAMTQLEDAYLERLGMTAGARKKERQHG